MISEKFGLFDSKKEWQNYSTWDAILYNKCLFETKYYYYYDSIQRLFTRKERFGCEIPLSVQLYSSGHVQKAVLDSKDGASIEIFFDDNKRLTTLNLNRLSKNSTWRQYFGEPAEFFEHKELGSYGSTDNEEIILYNGRLTIGEERIHINHDNKPIYKRVSGIKVFQIRSYNKYGFIFEWMENGKYSRPLVEGPAQIYFDAHGKCTSYSYHVDGCLPYGFLNPGRVVFLEDGCIELEWYYGRSHRKISVISLNGTLRSEKHYDENGKLHQIGRPASEVLLDKGVWRTEYLEHGKLHRVNGPAFEEGEVKEYYINGERTVNPLEDDFR